MALHREASDCWSFQKMEQLGGETACETFLKQIVVCGPDSRAGTACIWMNYVKNGPQNRKLQKTCWRMENYLMESTSQLIDEWSNNGILD